MAVDDINFDVQDSSFILEISGSLVVNAPVDMLTTSGAPNGLIVEIAAGSLNAPVDMVMNTILVKEIKLPDNFAS